MTRILVVQLYRIGDVLQTFPVLRGLRKAFPSARLDLLTDSLLGDVGALCPDVDRVLLFPRAALRELIMDGRDTGRALYLAGAGLERLRLESYDRVVNLHLDALGKRLSGALDVPDTAGPVQPTLGPQRLLGSGTEALYRGVADRPRHRRNLVDHFLDIARLPAGAPGRIHLSRAVRLRARDLLERRLPGSGPLVAVQSGTSRTFRGLDNAWVEQVQKRLPADARYAWLGSPGERPLIEGRLATGLRGACFAGDTGLAEAAALIASCDLVLSADTAALHLAALLGVRSVSAFFGTAQPFETGPYGRGHLSVYNPLECSPCGHMEGCEDPRCKRELDAGLLAGACAAALGGASPPAGVWVSSLDARGLAWTRAGVASDRRPRVG